MIETKDKEESKTIKAILQALKVKFTTSEADEESIRIAKSVAQGYKEMLDAKAGKIKARDIKNLLSEL
ncbi:hypothetical protein [Algoriphagus sp. A40]|uniref:hypothetical protein n=1 Tax=Algoriphagus sp. A40 TaxID=1945863 RepID=UPI0011159ED7|nr:hypothetical protein [Algoriphagus sp. A40]